MKSTNESSSIDDAVLRINHDNINKAVISDMIAGDGMAFNRIFARYYDKIYRFVKAIIHVEADVDDLVQELFKNLWEKRAKIDTQKNFNGFMYQMARNLVLDYIKAKSVRSTYISDYTSNFASYDEYLDSEDIIIAKEVELIIKITISKMPEQRRRIFEMHEYEGLSNEEIADRLSIKKTTVSNQLSLGRKDLEDILFLTLLMLSSI